MSDAAMTDNDLFNPSSDLTAAPTPVPAPAVGTPPQPAPAPQGDPAVWTVLGEAGTDPHGQLAVGSTLFNRMRAANGQTLSGVATDPYNGYEAWQDAGARARTMAQYPVGSPQYQAAEATLQGLQSGQTQPLPYDSFYGPKAQAALGRPAPKWDDGTGVDIGGNRFFSGAYKPPAGLTPDELHQWESLQVQSPQTPGGQTADKEGAFTVGPNASPMTAAQAAWYKANTPAAGWSNAPGIGDKTPPYALQPGGVLPQTPGAEYVDLDGNHHVVPGGLPEQAMGALSGVLQGVGPDLSSSLDKLTGGGWAASGSGDPMADALASMQGGVSQHDLATAALAGDAAQQRDYAIMQGGNQFAQAGRFVGQALPATAAAALVPEIEAPSALAGTALAGPARWAATGLTNALRGTAAAATNVGPNSTPVADQLATGALAGVATPAILGAPGAAINAVTGLGRTVSPEVANLADLAARKYGFTDNAALRSGQVMGANGDRAAATADSNLLGSSARVRDNNNAQRQAFMRGVTGTYGDPGGDVSPEAMTAARQRIGGVMNDVAQRSGISPAVADTLQTRIGQIIGDAQNVVPDNEVKPLLNMAQNIGDTRDANGISGDSYQALTRKNAPLDRLENSDNSNVAHYASQIRDALDDGLQTSASPEDVQALQNARFQYKNLMTVAKLSPKADPVTGVISPALLRGAVNTNFKNAAFQGAGNLGELAQIGQTFMKEPANSFTANRLRDLAGPALAGLGVGEIGDFAAKTLMHPEIGVPALASAGLGAAAKVSADAIRENRIGGSAAGIVARSLPNAPGAQSALQGIANVTRPVEIPLSALAGLHLPGAFKPAPGTAVVNAQ